MQPVMSTSLTDIEQYWKNAAEREVDADGLRPTARDPHLQAIVEETIEKWIWPEAKVFDIGCGDGLSTLRFAKRATLAIGVDYVIEFVERAEATRRASLQSNILFRQANVLDLSNVISEHGLADIAITIRCLINLPDWDHHKRAIEQVAKCVRPGGLYILSEGWSEGWTGINLLRARAGLKPLELVKYNTLLSRVRFEEFVSQYFDFVHYENLGFYLVMSRVVQPMLVYPDEPRHNHPLNSVAGQLLTRQIGTSAFSDADFAGVYVLRRK
jgi:SAM-dependent methyltransferase